MVTESPSLIETESVLGASTSEEVVKRLIVSWELIEILLASSLNQQYTVLLLSPSERINDAVPEKLEDGVVEVQPKLFDAGWVLVSER